jgi:hypothetical protein
MNCAGCGCTDDRACDGGCYWVWPRVCSSCWRIHTAVIDQVDSNKREAIARMRADRNAAAEKKRPRSRRKAGV